jgi:hypothetical protein
MTMLQREDLPVDTKRSRSAQAVLADMGAVDDAYARTMLTPPMRAIYEVARR